MASCIGDQGGKCGFQKLPSISCGGFPRVVFGRKGLKTAMDRETGTGGILGGRGDLGACMDPHPVDLDLECDAVASSAFVEPRLSDQPYCEISARIHSEDSELTFIDGEIVFYMFSREVRFTVVISFISQVSVGVALGATSDRSCNAQCWREVDGPA